MLYLGEIDSTQLLLFVFLMLGLGAALSVLFARNKKLARFVGAILCLMGTVAAVCIGILPLLGNSAPVLSFGTFPILGRMYFEVDALSGFFALIVSLVGAAVSVYSFRYMEEYEQKGYSVGYYWFLLCVFILSMLAVVAAKNALLFIVSWEMMTLSSYFLVTYDGREESAKNAGFVYLLIAHIGAAMLIMMFLILAGLSGSFDFANFHLANIPDMLASGIFLLALLGFGSKAGIIPFHIWLPQAHPEAPSGISAMMSGVMLKVAVYGFIRVAFGFIGVSPPFWWGAVIIAMGAISALLGVLYALRQHNLKRMLAYHSIENIGIIFIGIGGALMFSSMGNYILAALSLFAAMYHSLNHALFKSLLFMGAGAVIHATHIKDIEKLGGLVKYMPITAVMFFVASYAISGVPPLNGFVSEWLTFQALVAGANGSGYVQLIFTLAVIALALTSALAVAAFVKVFGVVFLGLPRTEEVGHAKEVSGSMLASMVFLAVACLVTGIFPGLVANLASPALSSLGFGNSSQVYLQLSSLPMFKIFAALLILAVLVALFNFLLKKMFSARHRLGSTWGCGIYAATPKMQYNASGFSMPLMRIFGRLTHPIETAHLDRDFFEESIYRPLYSAYVTVSRQSGALQTGEIRTYLLYMMLALIGVLLYAIM